MHRIGRISLLRQQFKSVETRIRKLSTGGPNTFYDSQSGSFITKPGSGGVRIHDSQFKFVHKTDDAASSVSDRAIVEYIREASSTGRVTSVSLPIIESDEAFRKYMHMSIPYLIRNRQKLTIKVASQLRSKAQLDMLNDILMTDPQAKDVLEAEVDILVRRNMQLKQNTTSTSALVSSSASLASKGLITRANLFFSIDPFVQKNEEELLSVIEVGEVFASLCDAGVKVINICLCSAEGANTAGLSSSTTDAILDYLREIIEEGLNLDVSGDALLERFSVQCVSESVVPGVVELAKGLGISRFTSGGVVGDSNGVNVVSVNDGEKFLKVTVLDAMTLVSTLSQLK